MQCNQSFCGNGYPNFGHSYTYNPPLPAGAYPEIIGEGDVTSLMLPDGSVQFFFTPTTKWWSPYISQPPLLNPNNPFWSTNAGIWFIRSIANPIPPYVSNQQFTTNCGVPFPRPCFSSECNINVPPPPYHLKFHNDCCTSTSDLHYFYPSLRRQCVYNLPTKGSAAVQVQMLDHTPTVTPFVQPSCDTCHCTFQESNVTKCACKITDKSSSMSIDEKDTSRNVKKTKHCRCSRKNNSVTECGCKKSTSSVSLHGKILRNPFKKHKPQASTCCSSSSISIDVKKSTKKPAKKDKKMPICECRSAPLTTDKSVTTYTDQGTGYNPERGRQTQTADDCHPVPIIPYIEKVHFRGKCGSDCSSSSCECSHSCHERK